MYPGHSESEIAALMTAMRQVGVGWQGREALTIFHQLIFDEWMNKHWVFLLKCALLPAWRGDLGANPCG